MLHAPRPVLPIDMEELFQSGIYTHDHLNVPANGFGDILAGYAKDTIFCHASDVTYGGIYPDAAMDAPLLAVQMRPEHTEPYDELLQYISYEMVAKHMPYVLNGNLRY